MTQCETCRGELPHTTKANKFACRVLGQMIATAEPTQDGGVKIIFTQEMVDIALADDLLDPREFPVGPPERKEGE